MKLGERIIRYRARNDLTQAQFAQACNVSRQTIFLIEKYNVGVTALTRAKIELVIGKEEKEE